MRDLFVNDRSLARAKSWADYSERRVGRQRDPRQRMITLDRRPPFRQGNGRCGTHLAERIAGRMTHICIFFGQTVPNLVNAS